MRRRNGARKHVRVKMRCVSEMSVLPCQKQRFRCDVGTFDARFAYRLQEVDLTRKNYQVCHFHMAKPMLMYFFTTLITTSNKQDKLTSFLDSVAFDDLAILERAAFVEVSVGADHHCMQVTTAQRKPKGSAMFTLTQTTQGSHVLTLT